MSCAETVKLIEMLFAMWILVGPRNHLLEEGRDPPPREARQLKIFSCMNYNYTFVFVKVIPKRLLVPFFPDTVYMHTWQLTVASAYVM